MLNKKATPDHRSKHHADKYLRELKALLRQMHRLADHKLGYPVSLLTYIGIVDNKILGINPGTLANVLLNNVGDPFVDSQTSLMEVKKHERKLLRILANYFGLDKDQIRGYVTTGGTEGNFASLWWSKRYLVSCALPTLIKTDDLIKSQLKEEQDLAAGLVKIPLNDYEHRAEQLQKILDLKMAISENKNIVQQLLTPTVFYTKDHTHYSIPKVAEILRLNIRTIIPNNDGSMNLDDFKKELILHQGAHPHSSAIIIANIGTTITGAIDNVPGMRNIVEAFNPKIPHTIHLDGALAGFVLPLLKPFGDVKNYFDDIGVNTIAFSAHKYPGLSQPCGIILAKKSFFEKAFDKSERNIEYVGNIRDVTITGSRSGLNVLMFYNALYTLGLASGTEKLEKMLKENIDNAKYLYRALATLFGEDKVYYSNNFNVIFPRPSMALAKKYQLMLTGEKATICVLSNVTKPLINQFIDELKIDKETIMKTAHAEYKINELTDEYKQQTIELFTKSFCDSEPITKHLNIAYEDYIPFSTAVVTKAIKDGLSKIILDKNNHVVACAIGEDVADRFQPDIHQYPKLKPVFALLDSLSKETFDNKEFIKGKIVHMWIAAVAPEFRSQRVYTELCMICVESAMRKGYDFAYSDFTNEQSEKITHHFKVRLCNKINYADFIYEGKKPFAQLKGGAYLYITPIRPEVKLDSLDKYYTIKETSGSR